MAWSTVEKVSTITLTNSNRTATGSGSGNERILGDTYHWTGKYYCEIQGWTNSSNGGVGLGTGQTPLDDIGFGFDYDLDSGGNLHTQFDGSGSFTALGNPSGHTVCIAVDFDNDKLWYRLDGGNWNGSGTANPATGTGGISITGKPALVPMVWMQSSSASATLATASANFLQTKPSGFSDWDTAEAHTNVQMLGSVFARDGGSSTLSSDVFYRGKTNDIAVLVVVCENNSTTSNDVTSVTDAGSLTWTRYQKFQFLNGANTCKMNIEVWWAPLTSNVVSKKAVTVHFGSSIDQAVMCLMTFRGVGSTSSPFDNFGTNSNTASSTPSVTITTSGAACCVGFYGSMSNSFVGTAGSGASGSPFFGFNNDNSGLKPVYVWGVYQEPQPTSAESNHTLQLPSTFTDWGMLAFSMAPTVSGPSGTLASTEAKDKMAFLGLAPPSGTMAVTESPDTWATASGFTRLEVYEADGAVNQSSVTISTTHPDTIIVLSISAVSVTTAVGSSSVSSSNLTWHRYATNRQGPGDNSENCLFDVWWAYAHDVITSETVTTSTNGGAIQSNIMWALVKGVNGNYKTPFEKLPRSHGGGAGGFNGTDDHPTTTIYETGPQGSSSGGYTSFAFPEGNVALSMSDLEVTSTGSPGVPGNYAIGAVSDQLDSGLIYFEVKATVPGSSDAYAAGFIASFTVLDGAGAATEAGGLLGVSGQIYTSFNASGGALDVPVSTNDIIAFALDVDSAQFWVRNTTSGNGLWNNSATADPALFTGGVSYGITGTENGIQNFDVVSGSSASNVLPFAALGGSGTQQLWNFGATSFNGTPPDGYVGWPSFGSGGGTHVPWQHLTLMFTSAVAPTGNAQGWEADGFKLEKYQAGFTVNRTINSSIYSRYGDQNVLYGDNETFDMGVNSHEWQTIYMTIVPGAQDPGSFEGLETADSFTGRGFGSGGAGVFGDLTTTETKDTFAASGTVAAVGAFNGFETPDKFSAFIKIPITGSLSATEATDKFSGAGIGLGEDGVLITSESVDILAASGNTPSVGALAATENADRFRAIGAGVVAIKKRRVFIVT